MRPIALHSGVISTPHDYTNIQRFLTARGDQASYRVAEGEDPLRGQLETLNERDTGGTTPV